MKQDERKALIGKYILLILGTVLILVPLLATLFSSFKPTKDIVDNFFGFPTNFTWDNFSRLLADGIGVVDVKDILTDEEIDYASNELYKVGANVKRKYSSAEYNNLDIYQINSTYYSALGDDDVKYFLARLIQAFAPGIPQVYYVGLLAGKNDLKLLEETKEGRNINRHYYSNEEIAKEVQRPVVKALLNLFSFRNRSEAFDLEGTTEIETPTAHSIVIKRQNKDKSVTAVAEIDLQNQTYRVIENGVEVTF